TLTTDNNGNAFLYGVFAEGATVIVKQGDVVLKDYTFTAEKNPNGTEHNKSYALDATPVIDGTLGGKAEATEDDITALVEQLKEYVDNGITTIIVPGTEYAMYKSNLGMIPAFAEALYLLTDNSQEDSQYRGTIDLILPDATEIIDYSFDSANALKSITLPKVTTVGDGAFYGCQYLGKMTFGSVITEVVEIKSGVFASLGIKSDNEACDLVLNCGQLNAEDKYKPNLESNVWYIGEWSGETEWKSITLTHTGECDECKANQ
ncbi:MAG: leucine-rich repeat protein, partial [Bacteroidaceae bacterium]|nr:leucine-rich repeat protein [Bacteroidaceae bacterium]